jgi:hypothetical protein
MPHLLNSSLDVAKLPPLSDQASRAEGLKRDRPDVPDNRTHPAHSRRVRGRLLRARDSRSATTLAQEPGDSRRHPRTEVHLGAMERSETDTVSVQPCTGGPLRSRAWECAGQVAGHLLRRALLRPPCSTPRRTSAAAVTGLTRRANERFVSRRDPVAGSGPLSRGLQWHESTGGGSVCTRTEGLVAPRHCGANLHHPRSPRCPATAPPGAPVRPSAPWERFLRSHL